MKTILIDGYNLIKAPELFIPAHLDLEGQRNHLINLLKSYAGQNRVKILVVFDTREQHPLRVISSGAVKVQFTKPGQEADDVIKQMIRREKKPAGLTVISSDLQIRNTARDHGVACITSPEFAHLLLSEPSSLEPDSCNSLPIQKFDPKMSEKELDYWKRLFEEGEPDE